jgi:hypothetical protein
MAGEVTICQRLQHAKSTGDPSVNADTASLARYIATVIYGIAVLRRGFATPVERVDRPVLGRRLGCNYRPTIRDAIDYRIECIQVYIGRSQFFAKLTDPLRNFVVRVLGGMRRRHRRPTFSSVQKQAGLLK